MEKVYLVSLVCKNKATGETSRNYQKRYAKNKKQAIIGALEQLGTGYECILTSVARLPKRLCAIVENYNIVSSEDKKDE